MAGMHVLTSLAVLACCGSPAATAQALEAAGPAETTSRITPDGRTLHTALGAHLAVGLPIDVSGPWQWSLVDAETLEGVTPLEVELAEDAALPKGTQAQLFWFSMDAVGTWTAEFRLHSECENSPVEVRTFHFMVH